MKIERHRWKSTRNEKDIETDREIKFSMEMEKKEHEDEGDKERKINKEREWQRVKRR